MPEPVCCTIEELPWPPEMQQSHCAQAIDWMTADGATLKIICSHKVTGMLGTKIGLKDVYPNPSEDQVILFLNLMPIHWAIMFIWLALMDIPRFAEHPLSCITWRPSREDGARPGDGTLTIDAVKTRTTTEETPC